MRPASLELFVLAALGGEELLDLGQRERLVLEQAVGELVQVARVVAEYSLRVGLGARQHLAHLLLNRLVRGRARVRVGVRAGVRVRVRVRIRGRVRIRVRARVRVGVRARVRARVRVGATLTSREVVERLVSSSVE